MYDKYICGKEIMILGTLSNSKDPDEMLHNVALFFVSSWCVNLIRVFLHDDTLH